MSREAHFHDAKYGGADLYPKHYALRPTEFVYQQLRASLGDISGKRVLEYGCGEGWMTADLARMGAMVSAFDVSQQAIDNTRKVVSRAGLQDRCVLDVMPAEHLNYPDDSFDIAVGFAIIHHLELSSALAELHRVLKPNGVAFFAEPLATNPAIQFYRYLTPQFRTEDERPLVLKELPSLLSAFESFEHTEYFVTALIALAIGNLPGGSRIYPSLSSSLHRLDRFLLRRLPALGSLAWYSVIKIAK